MLITKLSVLSFFNSLKIYSYRRFIIYEIFKSYLSLNTYSILDIGGTDKTKKNMNKYFINKNLIIKNINPDATMNPDYVNPGENTPFEDNTFDVITIIEVLQYVTDVRLILNEAKRILKDDGIVIATFPFLYPELNDYVDRNRFTYKQINLTIKDMFRSIDIKNCGGILGTFGLIIQLNSLEKNNKFYSGFLRYISYILCYFDYKFNNFNKKNIFTNGYVVILKK